MSGRDKECNLITGWDFNYKIGTKGSGIDERDDHERTDKQKMLEGGKFSMVVSEGIKDKGF